MSVERETIEVDVLCVGGGVASLSAALRLLRRTAHGDREPPSVMIVEKGAFAGAHVLSGAVVEPGPLRRLLTAGEMSGLPFGQQVRQERFCFLTRRRGWFLPFPPPPMSARGARILSLSRLVAWLAERVEEAGGEIHTGLAADSLVIENGRVTGVRLVDRGRDAEGRPGPSFSPGEEIRARVVLLGEGACGHLSEQWLAERGYRGSQAYGLGLKEVVRCPPDPGRSGRIMHTFGYPLDRRTFGGGFVYGMDEKHVAVGLVIGLDYRDPGLRPHTCFRAYKAHPVVGSLLADGEVIAYGAKVIPEGGCFAVPELAGGGVLLLGDSAGLVNSVKLKGVHLAVESGIAAGDALWGCWRRDDWSEDALREYPRALFSTAAWRETRRYRNVRAAFRHGLPAGIAATGISYLTRGVLPPGRLPTKPDHLGLRPLKSAPSQEAPRGSFAAGNIDLDLLTDLYLSGTGHPEDQPSHLRVADGDRWRREDLPRYGLPCTRFCPAQVYEWDKDRQRVTVQAANCLHCKACQIKDPLRNVRWTPPERGGPKYRDM